MLNYIYIGMELSTVPVYQGEVVPAPIRGFMVGSYQLSLGFGGLIINGICKRTSTIPNNNSWMIPYGLFYIIPAFVASCKFHKAGGRIRDLMCLLTISLFPNRYLVHPRSMFLPLLPLSLHR